MLKPNGVNHLALSTSDIKQALMFFNDALSMPLIALYWMHGAKDTIHGFLGLNTNSALAFVGTPKNETEIQLGKTHPKGIEGVTTKGTIQHIAFNVDTVEDLAAIKARLITKGIPFREIKDCGYTQSIAFTGHDHMVIEVSIFTETLLADKYIDEEVAQVFDISAEELTQLKTPKDFKRPSTPVKNTTFHELSKYKLAFNRTFVALMCEMPDSIVMDMTADNIPPTKSRGLGLKIYYAKLKFALISLYLIVFKFKKIF